MTPGEGFFRPDTIFVLVTLTGAVLVIARLAILSRRQPTVVEQPPLDLPEAADDTEAPMPAPRHASRTSRRRR